MADCASGSRVYDALVVRSRMARHTKEQEMEHMQRFTYESPEIIDTFEAAEVMGAAEGQTCGNGSQVSAVG
jgi:hypothetical protein